MISSAIVTLATRGGGASSRRSCLQRKYQFCFSRQQQRHCHQQLQPAVFFPTTLDSNKVFNKFAVVRGGERDRNFSSFKSKSSENTIEDDDNDGIINNLYLHVGPSGDCWTGTSIFAAKHLQPDYVKSIKIESSQIRDVDKMMELLEENDVWTKQIYDEGCFPKELLDALE